MQRVCGFWHKAKEMSVSTRAWVGEIVYGGDILRGRKVQGKYHVVRANFVVYTVQRKRKVRSEINPQ